MTVPTRSERVTELLAAWRDGDHAAGERVLPAMYGQLRAAAARLVAREGAAHSVQATDLVHEMWMRLGMAHGGAGVASATDRAHLMGIAVRTMRQVLIDHARRRLADKRGGGAVVVTLGDEDAAPGAEPEELLALFDALDRLGRVDARLRSVVELRYLMGLEDVAIAELLGVTTRTVQRDWVKARAWLYRALYDGAGGAFG
ncbi:MAG: ECF-type sigma factor [Gemmatimonadaceae bacterium]|jgi:RNA polymerase sigma factor (TIGR02999 family)|nr:ECF-type sigma factor [Gemmatimonadaceae bacterium]